MRTFDTDGSESETCGNGLRCVARYVLEKGLITPDTEEVTIETLLVVNRVKFEREGGKVIGFRANMGQPRLLTDQIPVNIKAGKGAAAEIHGMTTYKEKIGGRELTLNMVSMGNPHCGLFFDALPSPGEWRGIGAEIESHPFFPGRTNVEFIRVIGRNEIEVLFWERGVGETLASGTGAAAAAVASILKGLTDRSIKVRTAMGSLTVEWPEGGEVLQTGPAEVVFSGDYPTP